MERIDKREGVSLWQASRNYCVVESEQQTQVAPICTEASQKHLRAAYLSVKQDAWQ